MNQANSVEEFLKILNRYQRQHEIFYRGQAAKYKSVISSISRDNGHLTNEHQIYRETVHMYEQEFETLEFPIERLAKLQHYGIPTRLIDVTTDPLIALYFAVENVDSPSDGNVFVYVQTSKPTHSKPVKLLALLATLEIYDTNYVQEQYKVIYNESITKQEILKLAQETSFITFSDRLKEANPRLLGQKGAFVICGNEIRNEVIHKHVKPLDAIKPNLIIRIPYEHKLAIKNELDQRTLINKTTIYPEFPSVADYLKEKYRETNLSIDGAYSVVEKDDLSYPGVKRLSMKITLNKLLRMEEIHTLAKSLIEQYQQEYDVIFIFVAKNGDDYIMYNWILRSLWLNPLCNRIKMAPLSQNEGTGYSWEEGKSFSVMADYYDKFVFKDDKFLFVCNQKLHDELFHVYQELLRSFDSDPFDAFLLLLFEYKEKIQNVNSIMGDFGYSRNKKFNDYLGVYSEFAHMLDNILLWAKNDNLNDQSKIYQINKQFQKLHQNAESIRLHSSKWFLELGVTSSDLVHIDPYNLPEQPKYQFEPTLPLNPNGLEVVFNLKIKQMDNRSLHVLGETNLYDEADLLVSIRKKSGQLYGQSKASVKDRKFDFGEFRYKDKGYEPGDYIIEITVSIPSTQPESFRKKAGLEYENLAGPYVQRDGVAPSVKYKENFKV
ncbi:FRG domain-containing protein [Rossellomorea sp. LJF3]|uniref:FRG domain-containing protein n=1 Tax=Rossellomorea sp. LJF3 TaxID=3126099 RepID=UPI00300D8321